MGNQQRSNRVLDITYAIKNCIFGDGYLWKHPTCQNYKCIWTSINEDWLLTKYQLFNEYCLSGVSSCRKSNASNCFNNAKELYRLSSKVSPIITSYHKKNKKDIIKELDLVDLALWYLDDGCLVQRKDSNSYRFYLCIGNVIGFEKLLVDKIKEVLDIDNIGKIYRNNSKATERNKTLNLTLAAGKLIADKALEFCPPSLYYKIHD